MKLWQFEFASYYGGSAAVIAESRESALRFLLENYPLARLYEDQLRAGTIEEASMAAPAVLYFEDGELA